MQTARKMDRGMNYQLQKSIEINTNLSDDIVKSIGDFAGDLQVKTLSMIFWQQQQNCSPVVIQDVNFIQR